MCEQRLGPGGACAGRRLRHRHRRGYVLTALRSSLVDLTPVLPTRHAPRDKQTRELVAEILRRCEKRCDAIVYARAEGIEAVAEALRGRRYLDGSEVADIVSSIRRRMWRGLGMSSAQSEYGFALGDLSPLELAA